MFHIVTNPILTGLQDSDMFHIVTNPILTGLQDSDMFHIVKNPILTGLQYSDIVTNPIFTGLQDSDEEDLMTQKQDELENAIEAIMGGKKPQLAISDKAANAPVKLDIRKGKTIEVLFNSLNT